MLSKIKTRTTTNHELTLPSEFLLVAINQELKAQGNCTIPTDAKLTVEVPRGTMGGDEIDLAECPVAIRWSVTEESD